MSATLLAARDGVLHSGFTARSELVDRCATWDGSTRERSSHEQENPEPEDQDAIDTTVQPTPAPPAPPSPPAPEAAYAAGEPPRRSRFAWVSSPKVAAATVITAIALAGLGGAFALGRATADHDHDRVRLVEFEQRGPGGFGGPGFGDPGFGEPRFGG